MALDVRKFGPKSDKIWAHRGAFIYQEPFKKDSSTASRVINEVVLGTSVNSPFGFASHGDDDFSTGVSFFQIPHGFGDLAQWVSPVDNRCDLPRFGELLED